MTASIVFDTTVNWHYGLETGRTAMVYALLAKFGSYDEKTSGIPREVVKQRGVARRIARQTKI